MWFQRLLEIDDKSDPEPTLEPTKRPPAAVHNSAKIKKPKFVVLTPADFQRVRLMSILRPKEQKAEELLQNQGMKARLEQNSMPMPRTDVLDWPGSQPGGGGDFYAMREHQMQFMPRRPKDRKRFMKPPQGRDSMPMPRRTRRDVLDWPGGQPGGG